MSRLPSAAPAGAMALYDKYSALHRGIEETREQIAQCQHDQDVVRDKTQRSREERVEMEAATERAKRDAQDLRVRVQVALQQIDADEQERVALSDCTNARRSNQVTKQFIQDQHQAYLESSQHFRHQCKRLRVTAAAVGLSLAPSHAFLSLHSDALSPQEIGYLASPMDDDGDEKLDEELSEAMQEYERSNKGRKEARTELHRLQKLAKGASEREMNRRNKKQQLEAQLDRLRNDVTDLRLELSEIQNESEEARQKAQDYRQDTMRHRHRAISTASSHSSGMNPVTPSPHVSSARTSSSVIIGSVRNPYATKTPSHSASITRATMPAARAAASQANPYRSDRDFLDRRQHPHRTGRMRSSREFSTALDVIGGEENDGDEFEFDGAFGTDILANKTLTTQASTPNDPVAYKTIGNTRSTLVDSDGDDEDDLLSYVAFSIKN